jgi:high-affinity iron transporter
MNAHGGAVGSLVALVLLGSSVAGKAQLASVMGDIGKGKVLYQQHCAMCHGSHGHGDGPFGTELAPPAANLRAPATQAKSDAELLSAIKDGKAGTAMQAFRQQLSDQQVHDVLAFVRSLAQS